MLAFRRYKNMSGKEETKRKAAPTTSNGSEPKRAKTSIRTILAQTSDKALDANGELDVGAFVKARENEIRKLEESLLSSKKVLAARAFQQVPRALRRRTASHNAKKIPKRLRTRVAKEV